MRMIKTFLKVAGVILLAAFIGFFAYANMEPLSPGERIYMANPTGIALLRVNNTIEEQKINNELLQIAGVTSHTYLPEQQTLVVTYSSKNTKKETITASLQASGIEVSEKVITTDKPQCPVHEYIDMLNQAKYALNIRK